jgi:hypothetical protein
VRAAGYGQMLTPGKSRATFSQNVKTEVAAGKPQAQAVAIAYSERKKKRKKYPQLVGP